MQLAAVDAAAAHPVPRAQPWKTGPSAPLYDDADFAWRSASALP
ncbi:MAG: hypothetical protein ABSF15_07525 [Candidatus Sulfotelmatobacter sp.]|jgi:hypothetical protein